MESAAVEAVGGGVVEEEEGGEEFGLKLRKGGEDGVVVEEDKESAGQ